MNRIRKPLALVSIILSFVAFAMAVGRTGAAREAGLPQLLRGHDAVRFLNDVDTQEPLATGAFIEQARLLAADGLSQDNMGFSVAVSGDTAVVGAPADAVNSKNRQGSAYVYVRTGKSWTQQQKLLASDGAANDEFGYSVAIVGDTIAVGRHNTQTGVNRTRGAVYVFKRTGATWAEQQILTASDGVEGDLFGNSLAFENDTLIVGALQKNIGSNFFQGAAYVFTRSGASSSFAQQARLTADDGGFADFFGYSVAVSGDTVIAGAVGQPGAGGGNGRGWAYVYTRTGTTWTQQQKLLASDGASGDAFGFSVGVSGDTAVIGARADVVGSAGEVGSAYIFTRAGNAWTEQQKLTAAETTPRNDFFGHSVAISGDTVAIGSPAHEFLASIANHGAVYVFGRTGAVWTRQQKLVHADAAPDSLGQAVAFDGSSILAGAPAKSSARGAAYVFAREAVDPNRINGAETLQSSFFGRSVDMDGDTVIVGADFDTIDGTFNGTRTGAAYIFVRTGATWTQQARLLAPDGATNDHFGWDVAISGDTAIVGAYDHKVGANTFQGAVYVFTRSGASWTLQQKLTANDGGASDSFGYSVALDGDTVIVGAVGDDIVATHDNRGSAYVFTRTGATWAQQTKFTAQADKAGTGFGTDVAVSGNTALVGHPLETIGATPNQGAAYIFTRAGATWTEQQRIFTASGEQGDVFGISVALDGETAVVGSAQGSSSTAVKGTAYVYVRANSAWTLQQKLLSSDLEFNDYLGRSLDIDGDTIILGAFGDTVGTNNGQGSAYIFKRANSNWTEQQHLSAADGSEFDFFGISVAVSGDRAIVGAHTDDIAGMQDRGSAYIFALGAVNPTPTPTPTATATPTPTATATPTPTPTPATATVQFGAASYEVGEAEGRATVTVTLSGGSAGAASVDYRTIDADTFTISCADTENNNGGAFARCDFATSVGRLDFAPGETQKTIIIPIVNDGHDEGAETFQVVLSNPSGAAVAGVPFTTTVTVQDDDSATAANPIFTTPFFVRQHYLDFLSREPEANEPWSAVLNNCPNVNNNPSCDRILVSQSFFSSPEFRLKGFYVFRFYKLAFNRLPEYTEVVSDMSFVAGATPAEVYARKAQLATAFTQRQEFQTAYGNLSNAAYVAAIFGRYGLSQINTPDPQQPDGTAKVKLTAGDLISQLDSGVLTRAQVLRAVADSDEADVREFENAFVAMQYYGYLRRKPEAAGYEAWLEVLRRGDVRTMVDGFMNSTEYKLRFGRL